jgi:steroid delta-isomerase-like uncharacterized protein
MTITAATLKEVMDAFNRHDLDDIMEYFADDCSFDFPVLGQSFIGKAKVREGIARRFSSIPDVHYGEDSHWISADGKQGVSQWTLTGTTLAGEKINVRGCDIWEFRKNKITRKDSYWKIIEH